MDEAKECRRGEIPQEMSRLSELTESLHNRIGVLFERLKELMNKPEPVPANEMAKEVLSSQHAIDLSSLSAGVETDLDKVNEILKRLQI